ncbi:hypothetical protein MNBD_ALPHA02-1311, partial [hydrothermal vent metagenome]
MKNIKKTIVAMLAVLTTVFAFHTTVSNAKEIPAETLAKIRSFSGVSMSPDGNYIASMRPVKGRKYLIIESIDPALKKQTSVFNPAKATVSSYMWLNNDRLAVSVYYNKTFRGTPYREWRLISVGKNGKNIVNIAKNKNSGGAQANLSDIKSLLPNDNDHAIIQIGGSVYNVNIKTGKRGKRLSGSNTGGNWYADYEGNVRLGFSGFGTAIKVMMRGKNGGGWKTIDRYDRVTGNARYDVIGFSPEE